MFKVCCTTIVARRTGCSVVVGTGVVLCTSAMALADTAAHTKNTTYVTNFAAFILLGMKELGCGVLALQELFE